MKDNDLVNLWQGQQAEPPPVDEADVRRRAERLVGTVRRRNTSEIVAGLFVSVVFGGVLLAPGTPWTVRGALLAILVGVGAMMVRITRSGGIDEPPPADAPTSAVMAHHRAQLRRQRDLLRDVPRWYIAPIVPGSAAFFVACHFAYNGSWRMLAFNLAFLTAVCAGIGIANKRAATKLDQELASLESDSRWPGV